MPNLGFLKRLIKEDFDQKDQELIGKVGSILNPALEAITNTLNKGLNLVDLNTQIKDVSVEVNANGLPKSITSFKSDLKGKCSGLVVINAQNLTNTSTYPTTTPFISFGLDGDQIIINHISGLQANNKYTLKVLAIV